MVILICWLRSAWLDPLPDGSLPDLTLRTALYQILDGPVQRFIDDFQLEKSRGTKGKHHHNGLGMQVMFLWKHPKEIESNKKLLAKLIERWMRPLLALTTDYRKLADFEEKQKREIAQRKAILK